MSAQTTLTRAELARKKFMATIAAAKIDLLIELQQLGAQDSEIDTKSFDDGLSDGVADMIGTLFARLEREADDEGDSASFREAQADRANHHRRVA